MASTQQIVPMTGAISTSAQTAPHRPAPLEVLRIARRMFDEGFRKSVILRITGLAEEEYLTMIRELNSGRPSLV